MRHKDWTTLKEAGKVAFKKQDEVIEIRDAEGKVTTPHKPSCIFLEEKQYDSSTGAELSPKKTVYTLESLEATKADLTAQKATLQKEIAEIGKMITQIKKV